jgi:hypothetical protein
MAEQPTSDERLIAVIEQSAAVTASIPGRLDILDTSLTANTTAISRSRTNEFLLGIGLVLALLAVIVAGVTVWSLRSTNRCLSVVVAATSDRTGALAQPSKDRSDALAALTVANSALILTATPIDGHFDRDAFLAAGKQVRAANDRFNTADDIYQAAYAAHPPTVAPKGGC